MNIETLPPIGTIGPERKFYGYIVGLSVGHEDVGEHGHDCNLYAAFCYGSKVEAWIVPDYGLFLLLIERLSGMAHYRTEFPKDFGYEKLFIEKSGGKWSVDLP